MQTLKAVFVRGQNTVSVDDIDNPELTGEGDVLVKMRACGLCGSDLEKVYGQYGMASGMLGHEPAGEIARVGGSVKDFEIGDRVFIHHHVACNSCHYCLHGDHTMCNAYQASNIYPCGLSEQFLVPEWNVSRGGLIRLPETVTFDEASLIEPLACCIRALNKCKFQKGDDVAVIGAGPAGMMHARLAEAFGAGKIFVVDINKFRLDFAARYSNLRALNAVENPTQIIKEETQGRGVDLCVVATGSTKALIQSFEITRRGGKVLLFGVPPKGTEFPCDVGRLYSHEHSIIPSYAASEVETNQALKLIENKRTNLVALITHRFDISDAAHAVKCAHEAKDAMKVIVTTK